MNAEIMILNFNGRDLLLECLPSFINAVQQAKTACVLTVIDNVSTDDSVTMMRERFASVKLYQSKYNRVLCSFNEAVRQSTADIVFLMNNDIKVEPNFIDPLVQIFIDHKNAFMAAPKALTFDKMGYEGCLSKISFRTGVFGAKSRFDGYESKINKPGYTMQAGFGAFHRDKFLELTGYDSIYLPGTIEDSDLCFRAWKSGFECYYVPESLVYHKGQASFKKAFNRLRLSTINQRNIYFFIWKNISDRNLLFQHFIWLLIRPLFFLLKGRPEFLLGFLSAIPKLIPVWRRRGSLQTCKRSDREIFEISNSI